MARAVAAEGALASLLEGKKNLSFGVAWAPFRDRLPALKSLLDGLAALLLEQQ